MKKLALGALFAGLIAACGGGSDSKKTIVVVDSGGTDAPLTCNPLMQTGCAATEKCTWIIDATTPMYVGHIGCVPDGSAAVGGSCMFGAAGATGYDNCTKGGVCSAFGTPGNQGTCKQVCDNQGGAPMCDANHVCVTYSKLFSTGATSPAAAGVCDLACNPLADNDFDGSAGSNVKTGTTCGSNYQIGCYGIPSQGTPPATGWSCTGDINSNPDKNLRHRAECSTATGCADTDMTIYVNSCNQGYLPLFRESTAVSTAVCIAMCKPADCYDGAGGHCGVGSSQGIYINQPGAAPHRCHLPDISVGVGSSSISKTESCEYLWREEVDGSGNFLPSATSDTMGFCYDHQQYSYDPTGGNNPTVKLPDCQQLQLKGSGSDATMPLTYFGAVDFGCISTTTAGIGSGSAMGKAIQVPGMRTGVTIERPRFLYHRVMGAN
jgi:hypothetical protein